MSVAETALGTTLQVRRTFAASRDTVFHAWTDPDSFRQWFGLPGTQMAQIDLDVRTGGDYRVEMSSPLGSGVLFGHYLEVKRPERLVYTFCWDGTPLHIPPTQVTVEFHERGDATEIVLTHERQPSQSVREFHEGGWSASFSKLAELLE
jgi:uncharacterized protein YndB with AHSA1/START domain